MRWILGSLLFVSIFLMISATALAFPKDEDGYKEFYFGEDVNDILSKYEVISVKNNDDGSVVYTIEYEDNSLEQYDILAVPDIQLEFKDGKLCSINRFFIGASLKHAALSFLELAGGIENNFGKVNAIEKSEEDKTVYYIWQGEHCNIILVVGLNPLDIPEPDVELYRIFFTIWPVE